MNGVEFAPNEPLVPFYAALVKKKEVVAARIASSLRARIPEYVLPGGEIDLVANELVDQFIDALVDPSAQRLRDATSIRIRRMFERGLPPENIHALSADLRQLLLEVGLELKHAGIPQATDGIRRLVAASRISAQMIDDAFRRRTSETLQAAAVFEALFQSAPHAVAIASPEGILRFANPYFHRLLGLTEIVGRSIESLHPPNEVRRIRDEVKPIVMGKGRWDGPLLYNHADGRVIETYVTAFRLRNSHGENIARCAIIRELGQTRREEEERRRLTAEMIAAQERALEERATPLVPIAEGVLVMPIVGTMDAGRVERMLTVLLNGIAQQHASVVLLDLTGVDRADAESANAIVRANRAARLLGANVVLTGIDSTIARMFVDANTDFSGVELKGTLGDGVRWALAKTRAE
jgi:PAS domain S-box-containing protein